MLIIIVFSEADVKEILRMFDSGMTIESIRKKYHCRYSTLRDVITDHGRTPKQGLSKNRCLNESYFDVIDTDKKAYLLGMLFTDGSVVNDPSGQRSPSIRLEISSNDIEVLNLLKNEIKCDSSIIFHDRKNRNRTCSVGVRSKHMAQSLASYGIVPNKTYVTNHIPQIQPEHRHAFIHGMIDGDGSIYFSKNQWHINFCSHSKTICEEFYDLCSVVIGKEKKQLVQCSDNVYRITFNGKYAKDLIGACIYYHDYGISRKRSRAIAAFDGKKVEDIV